MWAAILPITILRLYFVLWFTSPPKGHIADLNTAMHPITALATIVTAIPGPVAMGEKFALFNGNHSVIVETGISSINPGNTLQVLEEGDVDCEGSVFLSPKQCQASFPGLFQDVYRGVEYWTSQGGLSSHDLNNVPFNDGMARAVISNGELYIVVVKANGEDHRRKILATLGSIHRVLAATSSHQDSLPPIEFIFSIEDRVDDVHASGQPVWVVERVQSAEPKFVDKEPKLVWRGKLRFAPKLRRALLDVARGTSWDDVKALDWRKKDNFLTMEDRCRYMFIRHVEGRAYSASLKYRQACRSVVVAYKLQYIQHHHHLLVSSGPEQNYAEVERDFSDLPGRTEELLLNPEKAQRIAVIM
ncbi:hypothetical protein HFD88_003356 [Aspergillus terreus]|nr:hypothetical protein HFD88_003356 [Aspergillus terreus]